MKDFESVYNKVCLKFQEKVDYMSAEYKNLKKESFKKASYMIIIGLVAGIVAYQYIDIGAIFCFLPITLIATLAAYAIILGKKTKESPIVDEGIISEIFSSVLKEITPDATYYGDRGMDEQIYKMGKYERYSSYHSDTIIEGKLKDDINFKTSFVTVSVGSGDDTYYPFRGYVTDIDLRKNFNAKFMIDRKGITSIEDDKQNINVSESFTQSIIEILVKYIKEKKDLPDVTIIDNKLLIRVSSFTSEWLTINNPLNKKRLESFYNKMYDIIELTNEILDKIKE